MARPDAPLCLATTRPEWAIRRSDAVHEATSCGHEEEPHSLESASVGTARRFTFNGRPEYSGLTVRRPEGVTRV